MEFCWSWKPVTCDQWLWHQKQESQGHNNSVPALSYESLLDCNNFLKIANTATPSNLVWVQIKGSKQSSILFLVPFREEIQAELIWQDCKNLQNQKIENLSKIKAVRKSSNRDQQLTGKWIHYLKTLPPSSLNYFLLILPWHSLILSWHQPCKVPARAVMPLPECCSMQGNTCNSILALKQ